MTGERLEDVLRGPVIVAPMGGGPSTPALVLAASEAGALGFLAGGYKTAAAIRVEMAAVRAETSEAFGVNVFVPGEPTDDAAALSNYLSSLEREAEALQVPLGKATWDDDDWNAKLEVLLSDPPPVVSFTFGCPDAETLRALGVAGCQVWVTVTNAGEARIATAAGADALCVQGPEAGAHRGTFAVGEPPSEALRLPQLVRAVRKVTDLPILAAGGISSAESARAALLAGAIAVQCGTAFLRCPESGAHPLHKAALADPRFETTAVTRAFSGRPARGLENAFMIAHRDAPAAYPEINSATRPLRAAAAAAGDQERMSLWAGEGYRAALERPAGEIVELLARGVA
ncbi:MAG TPA: nitronate monooxygenase [Acidimicrobiales bacterium]|nr:nitronate monooxygenase [Acidimicrobiales bacterium]